MNNDLLKAEKQPTNNKNFTKEQFRRFLEGKKKDTDTIIYTTENLIIKYDPELKVFQLYYIRQYKDAQQYEIFAAFKQVIKIKKTIYNISNKILKEQTDFIQISNVKTKDPTQEFNLTQGKYIEIGNFIKFGQQKTEHLQDAYKDFFIFLQSDYIPEQEQNITNCYGIFNKEIILQPDKYQLQPDINKLPEINIYEQTFTYKTELKPKELKPIAEKLREYLILSYTSQLLFSYSLLSPFRYFLMDKGLKEFSFLGLKGNSGTGKTTRNKILFNKFHTNFNDEGYKETSINTPFRLLQLQAVNIPLLLDDPQNIQTPIISTLKSLATSKYAADFRGTANQEIKNYYLIRPLVLSFNRLSFTDPILINRFIFLDLTGHKLQQHEQKPQEKLIEFLDENIYLLGRFYYNNIQEFITILNQATYNNKRATAKETIFSLGFLLLNKLFNMLGIQELQPFNFIDYMTSGEEFIYSDLDTYKTELKQQLIKISNTQIRDLNDNTFNSYNIYDTLSPDLEQDIKDKIKKNCERKGIFIKDKNFLLTKDTLNHISLSKFKLNHITELKQIFNQNEFRIIGKGEQTQAIKINKTTKTGFLLLNDDTTPILSPEQEQEQEIINLQEQIITLQKENQQLKYQLQEKENILNIKC